MLICQLLDFRRLIIWVLIFLFSGPVDAKKHKESEGGGAPSSLAPIPPPPSPIPRPGLGPQSILRHIKTVQIRKKVWKCTNDGNCFNFS